MLGVGLARAAMNTVLKNNRNLLRKKSIFKNEEKFLRTNPSNLRGISSKIKVKKISAKQLERIRNKTLKEQKRATVRISIFLVVATSTILLLFFSLLSPTDEEKELANAQFAAKNAILMEQKQEKYLFYLEDGDTWLKTNNYHNAIWQYEKALELMPAEYAPHYRLAIAYGNQCQYESKGCEEGQTIMKNLEKRLSISTMSYAEIFTIREEIRSAKQIFERWSE